MAGSNQQDKCFFKDIYNCGSGKLIQSSRIDTILSASEIRQDEIRMRPELSDGIATVTCHKNCISKYISPSTLANLGKRGNDDQQPDDPEVGTKRMRSSTGSNYDFRKHCLFCPDVSICMLPHEYDAKLPHQYIIPDQL